MTVTVCAQPPLSGLREHFQIALNNAIVQGRCPLHGAGLGPLTQAAVKLVAEARPDADPDQIAAAYDAFAREHG